MVDLPDSDGKIKEACKDYSKENTVKIQSVLLNLAEVFISLFTSRKRAKIGKAVKRTSDPNEQVRLGSSVVGELMIRVSDDFGS